MSIVVETKTSGTVRKETIDWAAELDLSSPIDTISTSTWTADNGLITASASKTNSTATVTISVGRLGAYCLLKNEIVTAGGFTYDRTLVIEIVPT